MAVPQSLFKASQGFLVHTASLGVLALITQQVPEISHDCMRCVRSRGGGGE